MDAFEQAANNRAGVRSRSDPVYVICEKLTTAHQRFRITISFTYIFFFFVRHGAPFNDSVDHWIQWTKTNIRRFVNKLRVFVRRRDRDGTNRVYTRIDDNSERVYYYYAFETREEESGA